MFGLGINVNVNPVSIVPQKVISSPKNVGTEPPTPDNPTPTILPMFLFDKTTVYPLCVFPLGDVVGVRET